MRSEPTPSLLVWRAVVAVCAVAALAFAARVATSSACEGGVVLFDDDGAPAPGCLADGSEEIVEPDLERTPALLGLGGAGLALGAIAVAWPRLAGRADTAGDGDAPAASGADDAVRAEHGEGPSSTAEAAVEPAFCSACGAGLAPGARFCSACGAEVAQS